MSTIPQADKLWGLHIVCDHVAHGEGKRGFRKRGRELRALRPELRHSPCSEAHTEAPAPLEIALHLLKVPESPRKPLQAEPLLRRSAAYFWASEATHRPPRAASPPFSGPLGRRVL